MTGGYNDSFSVIDSVLNTNTTLTANFDQKRFVSNEVVRHYEENGRSLEASHLDFQEIQAKNKILGTCWHP